MIAASRIRSLALEAGFDDAGAAVAHRLDEDAEHLQSWLEQGCEGSMQYMAAHFEERVNPDPQRVVRARLPRSGERETSRTGNTTKERVWRTGGERWLSAYLLRLGACVGTSLGTRMWTGMDRQEQAVYPPEIRQLRAFGDSVLKRNATAGPVFVSTCRFVRRLRLMPPGLPYEGDTRGGDGRETVRVISDYRAQRTLTGRACRQTVYGPVRLRQLPTRVPVQPGLAARQTCGTERQSVLR